jgi:tetratricopeptide (TPR) repeat protein
VRQFSRVLLGICKNLSFPMLCFFVLVMGSKAEVCPANTSAAQLEQQARVASKSGQFAEAEEALRHAIACVVDLHSRQRVVLLTALGESQESQNHLGEAEETYQQVLRLNETLTTPSFEETAVALNNLGTIALRRSQFTTAEQFVRKAYSVLKEHNDLNSITAGHVLTNLGLTLQHQGRLVEAGPLYQRAAPLISQFAGEDSMDFVKMLANLAMFDFDSGKFEAAIENDRKALAIEAKVPVANGVERAMVLNNLGLALSGLKRFSEAEPLYRQALAIWRTIPGARSHVAETLSNLSILERETGQLDVARQHAAEAMQIVQSVPDNDALMAAIAQSLGMVACSQGNLNEAHGWYQRSADIWLKTVGNRHPSYASALSNLASLETRRKHYKKAQALYQQVYEIDRNCLGPSHPRVAADLSNLAAQDFYLKHTEEAVPKFERSRAMLEQSFGPQSQQVAEAWRNLALVYRAEKQWLESEQAFGKAIQTLEASSNSQNPMLANWLQEYASVLRKDRQFALAEQAETRALGIQVRNTLRPKTLQNSVVPLGVGGRS